MHPDSVDFVSACRVDTCKTIVGRTLLRFDACVTLRDAIVENFIEIGEGDLTIVKAGDYDSEERYYIELNYSSTFYVGRVYEFVNGFLWLLDSDERFDLGILQKRGMA